MDEAVREYQALLTKQFSGTITPSERARLTVLRAEINALDARGPMPGIREQHLQSIRTELARIQMEIEASGS